MVIKLCMHVYSNVCLYYVAVTFDNCEEQSSILQNVALTKSLHSICICHVKCVVWIGFGIIIVLANSCGSALGRNVIIMILITSYVQKIFTL